MDGDVGKDDCKEADEDPVEVNKDARSEDESDNCDGTIDGGSDDDNDDLLSFFPSVQYHIKAV